jgi:hypothetical protein
MISAFLFLGAAVILLVEGRALIMLLTGRSLGKLASSALGFPMGAFLNALLFFLFTLLHIPLLASTVFVGHAILLALLTFFLWKSNKLKEPSEPLFPEKQNLFSKTLMILLTLSLLLKLFFGASHALIFPTLYYDSLSQWNMRAEVSYMDHAIAFDRDEKRGVSKPQYPILLHSLQIYFSLTQGEWKDSIANSATFLLTVSSFFSVFLLLGIPALSPFLLLPLATIHLGQGYGDLHVMEYLFLSILSFVIFSEKSKREFLLLSALFVAAASWVKQEGLFFGVLPWIIMVSSWFLLKGGRRKYDLPFGYAPAIILGSLWTVFLLFQGFPIGAHAGDFSFSFHPEAIRPLFQALFSYGSFGLSLFILPVLLLEALLAVRESWKTFLTPLLVIFWGVLTLLETLFVFVFTSNVEFLLNGQTFSRTMLIPLFILILGIVLLWERRLRVR